MGRIDLNIGRSEADEFSNFLAQNIDDIGQKCIERGIGFS